MELKDYLLSGKYFYSQTELKRYFKTITPKKMENLNLPHVTMLDVGDNKIKKLENLHQLPCLTELYAAKNKLTSIDGLETLSGLSIIAIQANFLTNISGLEHLVNLDELYIS
jgi:protein phosphatase 1 regulatory subunit 7